MGRTLESEVLERWEEHLKELLNKEVEDERMERDEMDVKLVRKRKKGKRGKEEEDANIDPPTRWEVEYHIQKTKNSKAPGEDNILVVAEMIKHGGEVLVDAMCKLIRTRWETEKMPERWKLGIICPIYKKGDKLECGNYRGITLLSAPYKILTSIINERVQKVTESVIGENQCGFRPNKGTTDQLFMVGQMMDKNWEYGFDLEMVFIDFEQAFGSVNRRKLSEVMEELGIPQKLIKLTEMTLKDTKAAVKINNRKTRTFDMWK